MVTVTTGASVVELTAQWQAAQESSCKAPSAWVWSNPVSNAADTYNRQTQRLANRARRMPADIAPTVNESQDRARYQIDDLLQAAYDSGMKSYRKELWFQIPSRRAFVNITPEIESCLHESGIKEGLVLCNAMHIRACVAYLSFLQKMGDSRG